MSDAASKKNSFLNLDAQSVAPSGASSILSGASSILSDASSEASIAPSAAITIDFSPAVIKERFAQLINDSPLRFAWFVGNLISVLATFIYGFSYRSTTPINRIFYRIIFLGAINTFSIVLYQSKDMLLTTKDSISFFAILESEEFHYLYSAMIWLLCPVEYTLAIVPFFAFSLFHVASFVANDLLHAMGMFAGFSRLLKNFTGQYHGTSKRLAAGSELLLLGFLVLKAIFFRKWAWITLLSFSFFIKLKTETSIFTKSILKNWEVRVDGLVSAEATPVFVKTGWVHFKRFMEQMDQISILSRIDLPDKKED